MHDLDSRLSLPGVSLAFHDSGGPGRAVLFLHGAGADHVTFLDQAQVLRKAGLRVVLLDLRGHGQSTPNRSELRANLFMRDVDALIEHCGLERPVLVGHSLGGNIAQDLVSCSPQSYSGLFLMGSTWNTGPMNLIQRRLLGLVAPGLEFIPGRLLPRLLATVSARSERSRKDAERTYSQVTKAEFVDIWRATTEFLASDPHPRTPIPRTIIRGAKDRTGNIVRVLRLCGRHEGVPERVVAGAGHFVSLDEPEIVTDALLGFLESLPR